MFIKHHKPSGNALNYHHSKMKYKKVKNNAKNFIKEKVIIYDAHIELDLLFEMKKLYVQLKYHVTGKLLTVKLTKFLNVYF